MENNIMENKSFCPHLEIQVAEHCNLNCASCTHFSPLAEPSFIDKDAFYLQLKKANVIFQGNCKSLKIMGGEPLLHPEITQLLYLARQAMPEMKITLQTNGILLTKLSKEFWESCHDNNILIRVTRYPVKLDMEQINLKAQQYCVNLKYHPSDSTIKSFNLYPLNLKGDGCTDDNHTNCKMKLRYVLIKDGRLFPCPMAGNIEHFNRSLNQNLVCDATDSISLDDINTFEEYECFAHKAITFCRYCMPTQYRRDVGWKHSQKSISEWI